MTTPKANDTWMDYTNSSFFDSAIEACPFVHVWDVFCSTCMLITRALESAYNDGHQAGVEMAVEMACAIEVEQGERR